MDAIAAVFARGGSQGLPGKNLQEVGGRSLVAGAIEDAYACAGIDRVIVSTDSPRIAEAARNAGAEVPWLRPAAGLLDCPGMGGMAAPDRLAR
jgi:N-acylneuraminate cytidylyltransferase